MNLVPIVVAVVAVGAFMYARRKKRNGKAGPVYTKGDVVASAEGLEGSDLTVYVHEMTARGGLVRFRWEVMTGDDEIVASGRESTIEKASAKGAEGARKIEPDWTAQPEAA